MKNKKDKITFKRAYAANMRAMKLMYSLYPQMVSSSISLAVWNSLTPYIGIYLSALIVEELSGGRDTDRLIKLVLVTLAVSAAISLVTVFLNRWKNTQRSGEWIKFEHIISQKMLNTDYANLADTKTSEMLSTIRQNNNGGGWGLNMVLYNAEAMLSSLFTIAGGLSLTVSLFLTRVPDGAGSLSLLDNPFVVIGVIALMLAITLVAPMITNKAGGLLCQALR